MTEIKEDGEMEPIGELIETIANPLNTVNLVLSVASFLLNCLHLLVLTRKSFYSSSINCVMIGIAISDMFTLFLSVEKYITLVDVERDDCLTSDSLIAMYCGIASWALQDYFRRCSTWLALLMAVLRILIVRNALDTKLSTSSFGRSLVLLTFCVASIPAIFFYSRFRILVDSDLELPIGCAEFQDIHASYKYRLQMTRLFENDNQLVLRTYLMADAVFSKFVPCLCFPICTFLLVRALRTTKKKGSTVSVREDQRSADPTTKLVILMTIAFFVAEAPLGVIFMIRAFFNRDESLIISSIDMISVFTFILTINSTCHFFICFFLSRHYRKTLRQLLRLNQMQVVKASVASNGNQRKV